MDALPSGTSLGGRYRLIDELGHGGMARVWRAFDDVLGRLVAVKLLSPSLTGDREFLDRFRVEARAAARLAHPNIASVFDYGEWDLPDGERMACIVMELLEGESLAARLRRGRLPWAEAVAAGTRRRAGAAAGGKVPPAANGWGTCSGSGPASPLPGGRVESRRREQTPRCCCRRDQPGPGRPPGPRPPSASRRSSSSWSSASPSRARSRRTVPSGSPPP